MDIGPAQGPSGGAPEEAEEDAVTTLPKSLAWRKAKETKDAGAAGSKCGGHGYRGCSSGGVGRQRTVGPADLSHPGACHWRGKEVREGSCSLELRSLPPAPAAARGSPGFLGAWKECSAVCAASLLPFQGPLPCSTGRKPKLCL